MACGKIPGERHRRAEAAGIAVRNFEVGDQKAYDKVKAGARRKWMG
jgi:hypothetical protein